MGKNDKRHLRFAKRHVSNSQTNLCKYELSGEVDVQFICLLHISSLLFYKALYGILQLLAVK